MKPLLLFQVLFLMLGSVVAQGYFLTPPYLQNVAVSSVTVMWESVSNIPGVVNYGTTNAYGSSVASTVVNSNANTFIHKAIISSLEEATVYYYQVSCNGTSHPEQHFKTATKDVNASFTVGIWGDSHYVNPFSKMAAYLVNNLNVDFCFSSGDLSNLGYDHADLAPGGWLENFLKSPVLHQAKFRFIFIHCPPFLERWQIAEMGIVKNNLPSLCEKYGVSAVFSGHMHGYERGLLNDVLYITQGGGSYPDVNEPVGPAIYPHIIVGTNKPNAPAHFNNGLTNHVLTLEITPAKAISKLHYFDGSGNYKGVIEAVEIAPRNTVSAAISTPAEHGFSIHEGNAQKTYKIEAPEEVDISVFNLQGKELVCKLNMPHVTELDFSAFTQGVYLVKLKAGQKEFSKTILISETN